MRLKSDDGAALGDDHRLGGILFGAAEDGSSNFQNGAKINAYADAAWSGSENGTRLEFYTMDGDASSELSLTLDSDLLATFEGNVLLNKDSSVLSMGVGSDFTITHDGTTGATLAGNPVHITAGGASTWKTTAGAVLIDSEASTVTIDGHAGINIVSSNSGQVDITSAADIDINAATTLDIDVASATYLDATWFKFPNPPARAADQGAILTLACADGAAMASGHRLGVIEFRADETGSNHIVHGAKIESLAQNAWDATHNDASLSFYTVGGADGSGNTIHEVLKLDYLQQATFTQTLTTGVTTPKAVHIDANYSGFAAQDSVGLHVDFARAIPGEGTTVHRDIGIDLDVASYSLGASFVRGMDIDVSGRAGAAATQTAYGIDLTVSGADINEGIRVTSSGTQLAMFYDASNYSYMQTNASGDLTVATIGAGTTDSDITLDADGAIILEPATSLTYDSVALTGIQTSAESFNDDDVSLMTSAAIKDLIETKYSYAYMTWSASGVSSVDGSDPEWIFPNQAKGIYEEDWNRDENIKATSVGATAYTVTRQSAVNGLVIPHAGYCVGFHAHGRNDDTDATFNAGLFHLEGSTTGTTNNGGVDYGTTGSTHDATLRWIATADEAEASGGADGTAGHSFKGPCKLVSNTTALAVTAGDVLLPAIMGPDASDEIFVTMTIILKIPLTA